MLRPDVLNVFLLAAISWKLARAQDVAFFRDVDQPPAQPFFGGNDVVGRITLKNGKTVKENIVPVSDIVPDTLVDPNGNLVADARIKILNRTKQRIRDENLLREELRYESRSSISLLTCILTLFGCSCIVACGVLPALLIKLNNDVFNHSAAGRKQLNCLLSFATGSLLGDVFLHLLPEVWSQTEEHTMNVGLWILAGILSCFVIEKCCSTTSESQKRVCAMMNICANLLDNFTHGLAVGASFLTCSKLGFLTTFAIVIHELPHEISDFAILLRGHFTVWSAVQAQVGNLLTAIGGVAGAYAALHTHAVLATSFATNRILAFTAGSFINIGLCQILPDLLQETDSRFVHFFFFL
ncbi:unnamed protein product [Enterobius vermicularis]|uniref:Zinc transporter ZIP13 n=1 Tax=Enterobius vermicularis TaxID=51028 RepID=A0A158Q974_ENTVE|nr:unnamed protein product [Enterobius vermicularis]